MCSIEDYDVEYCEIWHEVVVRARKTHWCTVCHAPIHAGDIYEKHFSLHDGHVTTAKVCAICTQARDEFQREHSFSHQPDSFDDLDLIPCIANGMHKKDSTQWRNALAGIKWRRRKYPRRSPKRWAA